jgi:hypothetical protein
MMMKAKEVKKMNASTEYFYTHSIADGLIIS